VHAVILEGLRNSKGPLGRSALFAQLRCHRVWQIDGSPALFAP
jgi:hypothetical protein